MLRRIIAPLRSLPHPMPTPLNRGLIAKSVQHAAAARAAPASSISMSGSQTGIALPSRGSGEAPEPVETSACPKGTLDASACNTRWKLGSFPFGHALERSAVRSAPSDGGGWACPVANCYVPCSGSALIAWRRLLDGFLPPERRPQALCAQSASASDGTMQLHFALWMTVRRPRSM